MDDQRQRPKATKLEWATLILVTLGAIYQTWDIWRLHKLDAEIQKSLEESRESLRRQSRPTLHWQQRRPPSDGRRTFHRA